MNSTEHPTERQQPDSSRHGSVTPSSAPNVKAFIDADRIFEDFLLDAHVPGLVYGVVAGSVLVHAKAFGIQDLETKRPVTMDSLFRIASMTKVFTALTILKLRDDGKLRLDDLAENYVPEMRAWAYPTLDSPRIRVRDLLNHSAGFVTDDPWGDRQQSLADESFSALLRSGVRFASPPATRMEYSNLGYAILGRIITNVSGRPYADEVTRTLLVPLRMTSSGFDGAAGPSEQRAQGHRWEDDRWTTEPTMTHGAFGAMGGLHVTANDYANWVRFLLSAWPPRDDPDTGPVRRATVRELAQGSNFPALIAPRPSVDGEERAKRASTYGMGMSATIDREFGVSLSHAGGYPGFGSFLLLLPSHDVGLFAFANRTYAAPRQAVYDAALVLLKADFLKQQEIAVSDDLANAYRAIGTMYESGSVDAVAELLADNFLLDRHADGWVKDLAELRKKVGACDTTSPLDPKSELEGEFTWRCATGRVSGSLLLTPTEPPRIQALSIAVK